MLERPVTQDMFKVFKAKAGKSAKEIEEASSGLGDVA